MHMALSSTELADGALGLQPSPWTAHASHLKQCLAEVCRQHWLWVARTHCLSVHICLQAAHTWVCVHLVCLLNSQQGWVFAMGEQHAHLGQSLCFYPSCTLFWASLPMTGTYMSHGTGCSYLGLCSSGMSAQLPVLQWVHILDRHCALYSGGTLCGHAWLPMTLRTSASRRPYPDGVHAPEH